MHFFLLIGAVIWHVSSSEAATIQQSQYDVPLRAVTQSENTFSSNFYKHVAAEKTGDLVCSSLSAWLVLSMMSYGARGRTEKQMRTVLALPSNDILAQEGYQALIDSAKDYKYAEVSLANKIFVDQRVTTLKDEFDHITRTSFGSEVQRVNFFDGTGAARSINEWCEAQTNGHIKDLIKNNDLNALTVVVLVNAVYFKGAWKTPFNPAWTRPRAFNVDSTTTVMVPSMFRDGSYFYGSLADLKAKFVEIPFKSEGAHDALSMFIVLPDAVDGLPELERNIEKLTMERLRAAGALREITLILPKFKISSEIMLDSVLKKMGLTDMFYGPAADFSGMSDFPAMSVSKILQKAFIEVNEEGSEGAAATFSAVTTLTFTPVFRADHPFIGFIAAPRDSSVKFFTFRYTGSQYAQSILDPSRIVFPLD